MQDCVQTHGFGLANIGAVRRLHLLSDHPLPYIAITIVYFPNVFEIGLEILLLLSV